MYRADTHRAQPTAIYQRTHNRKHRTFQNEKQTQPKTQIFQKRNQKQPQRKQNIKNPEKPIHSWTTTKQHNPSPIWSRHHQISSKSASTSLNPKQWPKEVYKIFSFFVLCFIFRSRPMASFFWGLWVQKRIENRKENRTLKKTRRRRRLWPAATRRNLGTTAVLFKHSSESSWNQKREKREVGKKREGKRKGMRNERENRPHPLLYYRVSRVCLNPDPLANRPGTRPEPAWTPSSPMHLRSPISFPAFHTPAYWLHPLFFYSPSYFV